MPRAEPIVQTSPPARRAEALHRVFGHVDAEGRASLVDGLLAGDDRIDFDGLLELVGDRGQRGAVWAQVQPGRTGTLWIPPAAQIEGDDLASLLHGAVEYLASRQVTMAQTLLPLSEALLAQPLQVAGFSKLADLVYLVSYKWDFPGRPPESPLRFEPFDGSQEDRLKQVIAATYEGTLDCPALSGVRSMDEVLTSYRDTGEFDPQRWLIVQHEDRDVGCLLLADHPAADQWELVYMGLMAEARGRGFGLPLVQYAQWLTRLADRPRLVVAVDGANGPAMSVYDSAGFVSWDQRVVFWRKFDAS